MRLVIDMQGAQAENRFRGIGRYTMAFAQAVVRNRGEHEVILALNGLFPDTIEPIRAAFDGLLPQENIRVWHASPVTYLTPENAPRCQAGELIREAFIASLQPDAVLVSSLFEGMADDAVTSIKSFFGKGITAVILYDLIPYIHRRPYLENPTVEAWYLEKIKHFRRSDLCLAISESSRQEGIKHLDLSAEYCVNISSDADGQFERLSISAETEHSLRERYGLTRNYVMYTGGIDHRKNIERLISAYAKLSPELRRNHQLAIVCSIQEDSRQKLTTLAEHEGLSVNELVLTGFVPEDDLIALYNLCAVFVFPSWHEGFGLPVLEAMRCGAPVIASNVSSLPEVVGLKKGLFDPYSETAISKAIERVIVDDHFRARLITHGKAQAKKFSWNESAKRAVHAMEKAVDELKASHSTSHFSQNNRPKLAYVSPLPPERSGISDYSAELLPVLAKHYDIEVIVSQDNVSDTWIQKNCPIRSVQWFLDNSDTFDRVLYHFGNSHFHQHMFGMLQKIPGVVVLHDFYLSGVLHYMDATGYASGCFSKSLYQSHGYKALLDRSDASDIADVIWKYPCSRDVLEDSIGVILHSDNSVRLASHWYGSEFHHVAVIPHMRVSATLDESSSVRAVLGMPEDEFVVCSFGLLGPTKLNHRLLSAWLASGLAKSGTCRLIFVGENHNSEYGADLLSVIKKHPYGRSVTITGWVDLKRFRDYLSAADVGVQLRTLSRGETSGTVLDCMNYGLATIANANGSMADLEEEAVWKLPDEFDDEQLIEALETLWRDQDRRKAIGDKAKAIIIERHDPTRCAALYKNAIEDFYEKNRPVLTDVLPAIAAISITDEDIPALAQSMAFTFPKPARVKQLLVDISELVQFDAKTGIQRVVRNVLREWLSNPPEGWRVEPVYAAVDQPYRYARQFTAQFLGAITDGVIDEPIDYAPGDIFFVLDLQPQVQVTHADFYQELRRHGVVVKFMVYDLLCMLQPLHFVAGAAEGFSGWLTVVGESDGAVCISKSVADELEQWMKGKSWRRQRTFANDWFHLGAGMREHTAVSGSLSTDEQSTVKRIRSKPSFLMVGTLEPRKGHAQVLDAFEQFWREGLSVNLVIVGKQGWLVEELVARLRSHLERGKHLFWLEGISDEYLEAVYAASSCLIAASYGEGFGLPLIEAAQHKLPIIARDIPVFREVAEQYAFYFDNSKDPQVIAKAVAKWFKLNASGQVPQSAKIPWVTWAQSAKQLMDIVVGNNQVNQIQLDEELK